ncbi:MAG: MarR family transcriptional regulator [Promethearchaeota archaeon]
MLFKRGGLNQKSLASEICVSEMTMSQIISRLETKQLVIPIFSNFQLEQFMVLLLR